MKQNKRPIRFIIRALLLFFLIFLLGVSEQVHSQCGLALKEVVLQEIGDGTYLKDFRVTLEAGKNPNKPPVQEFSILLNKGSQYRFNIKADKDCTDQVILKLYDFTKLYGSNYDASDGTAYQAFEFYCAKTQVYYLAISFAESKPGCAAAVVSFVKNYDAN